MKSIFSNKQYDQYHGGGFAPRITPIFEMELNGIEWMISPVNHHYEEPLYYKREFSLSLLEGNIDVENYNFDHTVIDKDRKNSNYRWTFIYRQDKLRVYYKLNKLSAERLIDAVFGIPFDEACDYIKEKKYEILKKTYLKDA